MEALVTMAIISIAAAIVAPNLISFIQSSRISGKINQLALSIQLAKSEALKNGKTITLCPSQDGIRCKKSNEWHIGWIVLDEDSNKVIKKESAFTKNDLLLGHNNLQKVNINQDGFIVDLTIQGQLLFSLRTQPEYSATTRCLKAHVTGSIRILKKGEEDCV